jgi:hypothetical protein
MANKINTVPALKPKTDEPTVVNGTDNPESAKHKKVEHDADRAAHKANETHKKYDQDHNTHFQFSSGAFCIPSLRPAVQSAPGRSMFCTST